jgi:hypothetical protein
MNETIKRKTGVEAKLKNNRKPKRTQLQEELKQKNENWKRITTF